GVPGVPARKSMIITILNQDGSSSGTRLASRLAMLRANAGRNVLLNYADSLAPPDVADGTWEALEIKAGAVAWCLSDKNLESTVLDLAPHYNDIVIDAGTRDSPGNRSVLMATNTAIVPIQADNFGAKIPD